MPPAFDVYTCQKKYTNEKVIVKVIKEFKSKPDIFKQNMMYALTQSLQFQ